MAGLFRVRTVAAPLLLAAALLLPPPALAKEPRPPERPSPRENLAAFWNAVPEAWARFKSIWEGEGSSLDPFGPPKPSEGSSLDPFGGT